MAEVLTRRMETIVAFGDVVQLSKSRSKDPEADGLERYVGLEHLDPGDLKIPSWGNIADGTTFTSVFKPGQVLFGKRRAYQRKVAVADFSGVCSGDIYVLEPRGDGLLPELLPFICQSDAFFHHAVATSAGSLSPRTNWKSLANFEFALPPLEEQRRIADVLQALANSESELHNLEHAFETLKHSLFEYMIGRSTKVKKGFFEEFCEFITDGDHNPPKRTQDGIPHLVVASIGSGEIDDTECTFISSADYERVRRRYAPRGGDVLLSCVGSIGDTALVPSNYTFSADRSLAVYRTKSDRLLPKFAMLVLQSRESRQYFRSVATGTAQLHLYLADLRRQRISVPSVDSQQSIVDQVANIEVRRCNCESRLLDLRSIRVSILQELAGDGR